MRVVSLLALALGASALAGCTFTRLNEQTRAYDASTVLVGRVENGAEADGAIVVGAYARRGDGWTLAHQTLLHEHGGYELIVPRGDYTVFAYADRNGNGLHDPGEPAATFAGGRPVEVRGAPMVAGLDLVLGDGTARVPRIAAAPRRSTQAGAVTSLDAPELAAEQGSVGYWEPMRFFHAYGGNVVFVEPYDPSRLPVLFVHGAAGSAQDWRYQVEHLDRTRYQAWLFVYPSGASVESMSHLLYWKLLNLQLRHRYERLAIVAHSMGGLVVRRFLLDSGASLPQVRRFVSLSTPWAGEPSADSGVKYAPAVVPSWRDMQPDGPFMRSLFDRRLPDGVEYDLLFGHRGAPGLWRPNNDGTVTLASQLRRAAQEEARRVFGYDEDHVSILSSRQVTAQLHALLAATGAPGADGRLEVQLAVDGERPQGLPLLLLLPLEGGGTPVTVTLSAAEGGGRIGALPPGRYQAGVLATGFAAEPRRQSVEVVEGRVATLSFRLRPDGTFSGYVAEDVARPAGGFRAAHVQPRIRRITLRGAGIERVLVPRAADGMGEAYRGLLEGQDDGWGSTFMFSGLPRGEYELEIDAADRPVHRSRHMVEPGRSSAMTPIRLDS